tara:strand:+ start:1644 stop:2129 length:486 start_codon:yes stop_codon:yes gene_type:complete
MKSKALKRTILIIISNFVLIIDQITKYYITNNYDLYQTKVIIPNFLQFTYVTNSGAAFSILNNSIGLLKFLSIAASIFLLYAITTTKNFRINYHLGLSILLGGCLGNGLDRIRYNHVIDFIDISFLQFPIFNLADISINIGIILILIDGYFTKRLIDLRIK